MIERLRKFMRGYGWHWLALHLTWAALLAYVFIQIWQEDPLW